MNHLNEQLLLPAVTFVIAFLTALWLHPKTVTVARLKNITDNPDKRKLQREPVPVLGGVVVFFGIVLGVGLTSPFCSCPDLMLIFALILLMLYTGTLDDIMGLTPRFRLLVEVLAALAIIYIGGYRIDNFHGLWGFGHIPDWFGIPLTVITVVGIINAINLIDGVNGLSSGYGMLACAVFGLFFIASGDLMMTLLATASIGALIPFFAHNVFGKSSRMFIGDGGTLMMGMLLSIFVLRTLTANGPEVVFAANFNVIPFSLAVLSIPVFDTLRVMTRRIMKRTSPFSPDKTHLHHAFIGLGCSHFVTTCCILALNLLIIGGWYLLYRSGCPAEGQIYFIVATALICTIGVYVAAKRSCRKAADGARQSSC